MVVLFSTLGQSLIVFLFSESYFENVYGRGPRVSVCICVYGTVTASDMRMHHLFIIMILTFIQGHTNLNHENNKT